MFGVFGTESRGRSFDFARDDGVEGGASGMPQPGGAD